MRAAIGHYVLTAAGPRVSEEELWEAGRRSPVAAEIRRRVAEMSDAELRISHANHIERDQEKRSIQAIRTTGTQTLTRFVRRGLGQPGLFPIEQGMWRPPAGLYRLEAAWESPLHLLPLGVTFESVAAGAHCSAQVATDDEKAALAALDIIARTGVGRRTLGEAGLDVYTELVVVLGAAEGDEPPDPQTGTDA
jgi:hypothetical protein